MSKSSQSAYSNSKSPSRRTYEPQGGYALLGKSSFLQQPEYRALFTYDIEEPTKSHNRIFTIVTDTVIEHGGEYIELLGDTRFVMNALLSARNRNQSGREISSFMGGLHGSKDYTHNESTWLNRAVQTLDHCSEEKSGEIFVDRVRKGVGKMSAFAIAHEAHAMVENVQMQEKNGWGTGSAAGYAIMPDITIQDGRH